MLAVVGHDLRPEETYLQLCDALSMLEQTVDSIFSAVIDRVESDRQRLRGITERIKTAQAKIDAISGSKKAITVFSSSKYPASSPGARDYVPFLVGRGANGRNEGVWREQLAATELRSPHMFMHEMEDHSLPRGADEAMELFRFFAETAYEEAPALRAPPVSHTGP
ncbi:hypothetical protein CBR_g23137 [Chara braunii]|uniref:WASH1 WAHD domain-containing protein n=1 Tax=Chara braunii TaxID=69332 RepID=A0A388L3Z3_CHABU|nr:hypothetical protein CBR_g23137 [Chara braunii]|eukprot:GBG76923.1 hypothetical protein CBR_g23137 [Chara braunii]